MAELTKEKLFESIKNIFQKVDPKVEGIDLNSNLQSILGKIESQLGADIDKLINIVPKEIQGDISSKLNELSSSSTLNAEQLQADLIPFIQTESDKFMKNPANLLKTGLKGLSALASGTSPTQIFDKMKNIVDAEVQSIQEKHAGKEISGIETAFSSVFPIDTVSSMSQAVSAQVSTLPSVVSNDGTPLSQDDQGIVNKILNKIKTSDITVMSIYLYLAIIFGLYFFIGFIFTNCIADGAGDVYYQILGVKFTTWSNIMNDISNMYSIPTTKPPTTRNVPQNEGRPPQNQRRPRQSGRRSRR